MRNLLIVIAIVLAVDVAWINIDAESFNNWGWIVVGLFGFVGGLIAGSLE